MDEERLQRAYRYLDDLFKIYVLPSISKLASDLNIGIDTLIRVFAHKEDISDDLASKLMYLWAIKLGSAYVPGPKAELEPIECSIFDSVYQFVSKNKSYKTSNIKDILPQKIEDSQYDGALKRVMPAINEILYIFFKKNFQIEETKELSSGITTVCPEFRKFEIEILDDGIMQYFLIYGKGILIDSSESLPVEKIVAILKNEGYWEK